jgi:tetratricopeptide (TPR) repeat protein
MNDMPAQAKKKRTIPFHRKLIYTVIAFFFIPALFFLGVEAGLRVAGYGYPTDFFVKTTVENKPLYVSNWKYGWRFFPPSIARRPLVATLPYQKKTGAYRVFVLGGSAAQGDPHAQYGFMRIVQVMMEARYPGAAFEFVNAAMTGVNSYTVREAAKDLARYEPDLFLIYMGNNEVVGPFGAGSVMKKFAPPLAWIRWNLALQETKTGQALQDGIVSLFPKQEQPATWSGMKMFDQLLRYDSPPLHAIYAHFRRNLRDSIAYGLHSGAKVLVSSVGSNLRDCAPFASVHRADLNPVDQVEFHTVYESGLGYEAKGDKVRALDAYLAAADIDEQYANVQFRIARLLLETGNEELAGKRFVLARDYDALRFRADSAINAILHDEAANRQAEGVYFIDFADSIQRDGIPGRELFYEHVHLTFEGHYQLARQMAAEMEAVLPPAIQTLRSDTQWLALDECARQLAFTGWDRFQAYQGMLKRLEEPPFLYQLNQSEQRLALQKEIQTLFQVSQSEALSQARRMYEAALALRPDDYELQQGYANVLIAAKSFNQAIALLQELKNTHPYDPQIPLSLGDVYTKQNKLGLAVEMLNEALALHPNFNRALYATCMAYANSQRYEEAFTHFEHFLALYPDHVSAHVNMALLYSQQGEEEKSMAHLEQAVTLNPKDKQALNHYGVALAKKGRLEEAAGFFKKALRVDPYFMPAKQNLDQALAQMSSAQM